MTLVKVNDTLFINKDNIDYVQKNIKDTVTYTVFFGNRFIELTEEEYAKIS